MLFNPSFKYPFFLRQAPCKLNYNIYQEYLQCNLTTTSRNNSYYPYKSQSSLILSTNMF